MYGIVTRNRDELLWEEFDRGCFEMKDVTGRYSKPADAGINLISCFGDTTRGEAEPDLVPVAKDGSRATRDRRYFDWGFICPTRSGYREELLELVDRAAECNPNVRLGDIGFPRAEYCYCEKCSETFAASQYEDRERWRASIVTDFVAAARDRVPGELSVTVYPDPYPGHLLARSGVDLDALSKYADEFVVPLYDLDYGTTYWLEILASGFDTRLSVPFSIELYAVNVDVDRLVDATSVAGAYADHVFFGYDAGTARAAVRRIRAEASTGESFGEPPA